VVDVSALRRGKPTANSVWGDKASVLVGDFLFTRSFELMVEVGSLDILGVLSRASSTIAEGRGAAARHPARHSARPRRPTSR
jgi:octaprenyl-diphosphate synthase